MSKYIIRKSCYESYHFFWRMLKKYYTYKIPSSGRSVQWTPFFPLSFPKTALKDLGLTVLAISGS